MLVGYENYRNKYRMCTVFLMALASLRTALAAALTSLAAALSRAAWASRSLVGFLYAVSFVLAMMITCKKTCVRKHVRICTGICTWPKVYVAGRNFVHLPKTILFFGKEDCDRHFP